MTLKYYPAIRNNQLYSVPHTHTHTICVSKYNEKGQGAWDSGRNKLRMESGILFVLNPCNLKYFRVSHATF